MSKEMCQKNLFSYLWKPVSAQWAVRYTNDCFRPKPHLYLRAYLQLVRAGLEAHVSVNVELPASFLKGFFLCVWLGDDSVLFL